jgi:hypothetical protein
MPISTSVAVLTATIANGATLSDVVDLGASAVCGMILPTLTGTTLSIQGCDTSGGTYATLKDINGTAATITVATVGAGAYLYLDPLMTAGWQYIKLLSQAAEGSARSIKLLIRPV